MLAFAWPWDGAASDRHPNLSDRLGASLCAGIAGHAGTAEVEGLHFAYRPLRSTAAISRAWRPATLPGGRVAVFHGYFDNAEAIGAEIGADHRDVARLYALAVERWGDGADGRVIGEFAAIIVHRDERLIRLSRSPLRAPPLCYYHDELLAAAASVPRALFATGIEQRLNETKVADCALLNFTDDEMSWFTGISRVPLGSVVELQRGRTRVLRRTYDPLAVPKVRMKSDADYIARAEELLDEGVKACLAGFKRPAATLSSGLDSPQVAVRTLAALPPGQRLPTFTFHPEHGFDGRCEAGKLADERPMVEAFAAMHPGLEPYFTANQGYGHDHRWNEFFHLMGGAPSGMCNLYVFHGLFKGAVDRGCDVLLLAEWGNFTFSDKGSWGFVEYLLKGRWRQLWLALARQRSDRSMAWRFLSQSVLPLLPDSAWVGLRRLAFPGRQSELDLLQPLSPAYRASSGADRRLRDAGIVADRYQPRTHRQSQALFFQDHERESGEIYQAFEQMYDLPQRDPMAYRPFAEFCFGLPTEMFMRDGTTRWLAKQMAKGIMPEEQRTNRLNGRWDADWLLRVRRRRDDYVTEIQQLASDPRMAAMLDLPRMKSALENLPDRTELDPQKYFSAEFAVPRGMLAARFIKYVEGRNQP